MKSLKPTASLFFDNRHEKIGGTYSVKLTIYYAGEKKRYSTNIEMTSEDWKKINSDKLRNDDLKILKRKLNSILSKAEKIVEAIEPFSFIDFENQFFERVATKASSSLEKIFDIYIDKLMSEGRIGNALSNKTTKNSLLSFKSHISIFEITPDFLAKYENFMKQKNASPSTIGIYLRHLRAIINKAIEDGVISRDKYPFIKYKIPSSRNIKKALSFDELKQVLEYKSENANLQKAADFWIFTYLSNGINMTDILLLKHKNVEGNFIFFHRAKTINTKKKDLRPIRIYLTDRAKSIITKWKSDQSKNDYLFPVLEAGLTPLQIKHRIKRFLKFVNGNMKIVGIELGIDKPMGTYTARHTHATVLKRKGVSIAAIGENLGHSSASTTESYLDSFTDDVKKEYAEMLTDF